jgi:hypothetical protein
MPYAVVDLLTLTATAAGTNSTIATNLDDAYVIGIVLNSTTTSGTAISNVMVELSATGTNFFPLSYYSSGGSPVTISSSQAIMIPYIGFRQLRLSSSAASANARTYLVTKQILV